MTGTKSDTSGLMSAAVTNKQWQKYGPTHKMHIWLLPGYDTGDIDSRGNPKKGAKNLGGDGGGNKKSNIQMNKKQAAMLVTETLWQINAPTGMARTPQTMTAKQAGTLKSRTTATKWQVSTRRSLRHDYLPSYLVFCQNYLALLDTGTTLHAVAVHLSWGPSRS